MRTHHKWKARPLKDPTGNLQKRGAFKKRKKFNVPAALGCSIQCLSFNSSYLCSPPFVGKSWGFAIHSCCNSFLLQFVLLKAYKIILFSRWLSAPAMLLKCPQKKLLLPKTIWICRVLVTSLHWFFFFCATSVSWMRNQYIVPGTPIKYLAPHKPSLGYALQFVVI